MLAVQAVMDFTATTPDQISVKNGQIFYVLSITEDNRKYYLSTSSRVPFSRVATAGYAPIPLFIVVGDTLPANQRPERKFLPQPRYQVAPAGEETKLDLKMETESQKIETAAHSSTQKQRSGSLRGIAAAARNLFDGMTSSKSNASNKSSGNSTPVKPTILTEDRDLHHSMMTSKMPIHITAAQIMTFKKRRACVEYRILFRRSDGERRVVKRTYGDFHAMHTRRYTPSLLSFPDHQVVRMPAIPRDISEEIAHAEDRGRALNATLQELLAVQKIHFASSSDVRHRPSAITDIISEFLEFASFPVHAKPDEKMDVDVDHAQRKRQEEDAIMEPVVTVTRPRDVEMAAQDQFGSKMVHNTNIAPQGGWSLRRPSNDSGFGGGNKSNSSSRKSSFSSENEHPSQHRSIGIKDLHAMALERKQQQQQQHQYQYQPVPPFDDIMEQNTPSLLPPAFGYPSY